MREPDVLALQRCMADLALDAQAGDFETDPASFGERRGLSPEDQAGLERFQDRLLFYRDAVREAIWEPLDRYIPITQSLLEEAGAWEECRTAFLASRSLRSPFYRDIAPTFLGWMAASGWGRDRWPFLLELTHFELVKEWVEHVPDGSPADHLRPELHHTLALAAPTQVLTYAWRVFEATPLVPAPPAGACHLLASRGLDGYVRIRELTEAAAALLVRAQSESIASAMAALGMKGGPETLSFLEGLRADGALAGFRDA